MAGSTKGEHNKKKEESNPHKSKENNRQIEISPINSDLGSQKEGDKCDAKHYEDKKKLASQSEKNVTSSASPQEHGQSSLEAFKFNQIPDPFEGFQEFCDETRQRNNSEEQNDEMIFSLGELSGILEQQVEDRKKWALKKRREARASIASHTHELIMLSSEKEKRGQLAKEMSKKMLKKGKAKRSETDQLDRLYEQMREVEAENLRLLADVAAIELGESESKKNLKKAVRLEKEDLKKMTQGLINQEKEKILQLEVELKNVVQAQEEAELKSKQKLEEKEQAGILVSVEKKLTRIAGEDRNRKLSSLEQELEIERRRVIDDNERLMLQASHLKTQHLLASGVSEAGSSQNLAQAMLIPDHRRCIFCCRKEVSVVFMPCSHQVACVDCSMNVRCCPSCGVQIAEKYKVYSGTP